tara:strand:+ start:281 stop:466 length:186 start_codon:yes stop_codon:yes gene_type:complete
MKLSEKFEVLEEENEELRNRISRLEAFIEPCAIGHEQLWKIVREDIQGLPVPNGVDLRNLI